MESRRVTFLTKDESYLDEIKGFIAVVYDKDWWLGCVIKVKEDENKVVVNLLIPHGPSQSFKYPVEERIVIVPIKDLLTKVFQEPAVDVLTLYQGKKARELPSCLCVG